MGMSFVFEDVDSMRSVCGPNDGNISYIEKLLGCELSVRGNRLEYSGDNEDTGKLLAGLLERLRRLSSITSVISSPEILMEYRALLEDIPLQTENSKGGGAEKADNGGAPAYTDTQRPRHIITVGTRTVYPKSARQEEYIGAMETCQAVFVTGPAGTGKTFLAVSWCLGELFAGRKQKIILTRPVVEAGESLGFLPGDLSQKLNPYLRPLYDSMEATVSPGTIKRLEESGQIEISPLAYMRGRSINNACVILDEAQNTTKAQMKMFLTRLGENSSAIITGDITQIDLPKAETSGLTDAVARLRNVEGVYFVNFTGSDTVRSRIVQRIIKAYEKE